eukprot:3081907-Pyramimonas_sp.AAC.1
METQVDLRFVINQTVYDSLQATIVQPGIAEILLGKQVRGRGASPLHGSTATAHWGRRAGLYPIAHIRMSGCLKPDGRRRVREAASPGRCGPAPRSRVCATSPTLNRHWY